MSERPPIPPDIKREVRQRCGFGCVICGLPIYEYEHMLEWAVVQRHVANEITLLCRQHHGEKTLKLLPVENVRAANLDPFNKRTGVSTNYLLHYSGDSVKVMLGSSAFSYEDMPEGYAFAPLVIDGHPMIMFTRKQGNLFLSFTAQDEFNKTVLHIHENEIVYDTGQWDAEWVGQSLTIRESHRKILLKITFRPPNEIAIEKGRMLRNGVEVLISNKYVFITNNGSVFVGVTTINCAAGLSVGDPIPSCGTGFAVTDIPRYVFDRKKDRQHLRAFLSRLRNTP